MKDVLRLFTPPEWSWWSVRDRLAYVVSLVALLALVGLGAWQLHNVIDGALAGFRNG